jgi:hypothetical protein
MGQLAHACVDTLPCVKNPYRLLRIVLSLGCILPSAAMQVPGVAGFFCARDVPGSNWIGPVVADEEVFATTEVTCVGQVGGCFFCSCIGCLYLTFEETCSLLQPKRLISLANEGALCALQPQRLPA